jgi:hypothetical protein
MAAATTAVAAATAAAAMYGDMAMMMSWPQSGAAAAARLPIRAGGALEHQPQLLAAAPPKTMPELGLELEPALAGARLAPPTPVAAGPQSPREYSTSRLEHRPLLPPTVPPATAPDLNLELEPALAGVQLASPQLAAVGAQSPPGYPTPHLLAVKQQPVLVQHPRSPPQLRPPEPTLERSPGRASAFRPARAPGLAVGIAKAAVVRGGRRGSPPSPSEIVMRNRISAQKSNEKRRRRIEGWRAELDRLKTVVLPRLQVAEKALREQNDQVRQALRLQFGSENLVTLETMF